MDWKARIARELRKIAAEVRVAAEPEAPAGLKDISYDLEGYAKKRYSADVYKDGQYGRILYMENELGREALSDKAAADFMYANGNVVRYRVVFEYTQELVGYSRSRNFLRDPDPIEEYETVGDPETILVLAGCYNEDTGFHAIYDVTGIVSEQAMSKFEADVADAEYDPDCYNNLSYLDDDI